jgi:hypothetical protein
VSKPITQLGLWSAVLSALFSIAFIAGVFMDAAGVLQAPWDVIVPVGASLLLAPAFVVMMVCVHYIAPDQKKIWSHIGFAFALLYATLVSIVYVVWLFVVEPKVISGHSEDVAPFLFERGSFQQMVDGLGYTYMGIATLFAAFVFSRTRGGVERWVRRLFLINGVLSIMVFLSYVFYTTILGAPWAFVFTALAIVLAVHFRQVQRKEMAA